MNKVNFKQGLRSSFDSVETKDSDTIYFITDTQEIYKGNTLFAVGFQDEVYFTSLSDAISFSNNNSIDFNSLSFYYNKDAICSVNYLTKRIKLISDIVITDNLTISGNCSIDLNGYSINCQNCFISSSDSSANIKIYSSEEGAVIESSGVLCTFNFNVNSIELINITIKNENNPSGITFAANLNAANYTLVKNCKIVSSSNTNFNSVGLNINGSNCTIVNSSVKAVHTVKGNYYSCTIAVNSAFTGYLNIFNSEVVSDSFYFSETSQDYYVMSINGNTSITIENSLIECFIRETSANSAGYYGVALVGSSSKSCKIVNSRIEGSLSSGHFSGVNVNSSDSCSIISSKISTNSTPVSGEDAVGSGVSNRGSLSISESDITGSNAAVTCFLGSSTKIINSQLMAPNHGGAYVGSGSTGSFEMYGCKCINNYDQYSSEELGSLVPSGAIYFGADSASGAWSVIVKDSQFYNPSVNDDTVVTSSGIVLRSYDNTVPPTLKLYGCRVEAYKYPIRVDEGAVCELYPGTEYFSYTNSDNLIKGSLIDNRNKPEVRDFITPVSLSETPTYVGSLPGVSELTDGSKIFRVITEGYLSQTSDGSQKVYLTEGDLICVSYDAYYCSIIGTDKSLMYLSPESISGDPPLYDIDKSVPVVLSEIENKTLQPFDIADSHETEISLTVKSSGTSYYYSELSSLSLSFGRSNSFYLPNRLLKSENRASFIYFISGDTPTSLTYSGKNVVFTGDDCDSEGDFVPIANRMYRLEITGWIPTYRVVKVTSAVHK